MSVCQNVCCFAISNNQLIVNHLYNDPPVVQQRVEPYSMFCKLYVFSNGGERKYFFILRVIAIIATVVRGISIRKFKIRFKSSR